MSDQVQMPTHVLVVDDDADIVEFVTTFLKSSGYRVTCAYDGEDALQKAREHLPQFVLLDLNIPIQDGWLVCSKLKLVKSAPKIVFITGETRPDLEQFAEFVHADAVLHKPFGVEDIKRVIDELDKDERASA
jgi:DNA-binding response OmpR family regulator